MKPPLLEVKYLSKNFRLKNEILHAVNELTFSVSKGEIFGLGGESGCGKSTLAKLLMGLIEPSSGLVQFNGNNLTELMAQRKKSWRSELQMIFQHPTSSLNPRMSVEEILSEPLIIHKRGNKIERKKRVMELLSQVGLPEEYREFLPLEMSGGQKQRIAIARAMALEPKLLICDEPFSALDVSIQAQIINLLSKLQREHGLTYIVISHDLSVLRYFTHRLAIMYLGQLVECGPSTEVYDHPLHPYTQALVSAVLLPDLAKKEERVKGVIKGEVPSAIGSTIGCPFYARCPHAQKICQTTRPVWKEVRIGRFAACHLF